MKRKKKILIAEDNTINRMLLEELLVAEYSVVAVANGKDAVDYLQKNSGEISAFLLDLYMPQMDGFAVLDALKSMGLLRKIPVIILSGEDAAEVEGKALEQGAVDFIHKPYNWAIVQRRIFNSMELFESRNYLEKRVRQQTKDLNKKNVQLREQAKALKSTNEKIIDVLGTTVEFRHMESYDHINRVKGFTRCLAMQVRKDYPEYGLRVKDVERIASASSLHDIGKISIPDSILLKPGPLTEEEYEFMKSHTVKGCEILKRVNGIWDEEFGKTAYEICRHHHERYDGRGYPDHLVGEDIPIAAQIVSIADVYDALICARVYKDAIEKGKAFRMIQEGECGVFSDKLLKCFENCREEMEHLASVNKGEEENPLRPHY